MSDWMPPGDERPGMTGESSMRLKSGIWVAAYLRRCQVEGVAAVLRRRGAEEAGAIFIKVSRLDGSADLYGPAPQSAFDEARPSERVFSPALKGLPLPEADIEAYLGAPDPLRSGSLDRRGRGSRRAALPRSRRALTRRPVSVRAGACGSATPARRVAVPRRERAGLVVVVHRAMRRPARAHRLAAAQARR